MTFSVAINTAATAAATIARGAAATIARAAASVAAAAVASLARAVASSTTDPAPADTAPADSAPTNHGAQAVAESAAPAAVAESAAPAAVAESAAPAAVADTALPAAVLPATDGAPPAADTAAVSDDDRCLTIAIDGSTLHHAEVSHVPYARLKQVYHGLCQGTLESKIQASAIYLFADTKSVFSKLAQQVKVVQGDNVKFHVFIEPAASR